MTSMRTRAARDNPYSQTEPNPEPAKSKRKEPVLIRFDEHTLEQVDRAAAKRGVDKIGNPS